MDWLFCRIAILATIALLLFATKSKYLYIFFSALFFFLYIRQELLAYHFHRVLRKASRDEDSYISGKIYRVLSKRVCVCVCMCAFVWVYSMEYIRADGEFLYNRDGEGEREREKGTFIAHFRRISDESAWEFQALLLLLLASSRSIYDDGFWRKIYIRSLV